MRRLAVQSRDDGYSSNRDYQQIHNKIAQRLVPSAPSNRIVLRSERLISDSETALVGFGGFIRTPTAIRLAQSRINRTESQGQLSR